MVSERAKEGLSRMRRALCRRAGDVERSTRNQQEMAREKLYYLRRKYKTRNIAIQKCPLQNAIYSLSRKYRDSV